MAYCTDANWLAREERLARLAPGALLRELWRLTIVRVATGLFDAIRIWRARANARRQLLALDERMLKDIGVSRAAAQAEARKPFFD